LASTIEEEATTVKTDTDVQPLALSVEQFCRAHSISIGFFYELLKRGKGPRLMKLGTRTLISFEEAARWRAERTAASGEAA
jgi:predicted DNA-binding transcriptional regulator AlpA